MRLSRQAAAILLAVVTTVANVAVCGGWKATPEARMACCAEGVSCPMRAGGQGRDGHRPALTQHAADACCAASESDPSSPPAPYLPAPLALVSFAWLAPAADVVAAGRAALPVESPPPPSSVSRHLLLSVLLV